MEAMVLNGQEQKPVEEKEIEILESITTKRCYTLKKISEEIARLEETKKTMEAALSGL